jgi:DNA helicase-2/ATP-dependent DNA helicase PcrA
MSSLLDSLNADQRAAVTLPNESALILAGAGSGKTRVLTTRIAWLLHQGQVTAGGLLAVTFTNKAAREMLARLTALLPINTRGMWVGTFHGLCNRFLRSHHQDANLPALFQILDQQDQQSAIKRVLKAVGADEQKYQPRNVGYFINGHKEEGRRPVDLAQGRDVDPRMIELYETYEAQCQREGVVDFAELLLRSFEVLSRNEELREHYRARFRHILVDEFQDTNHLQYRWLKLLAGANAAVFAVGDDDQSIYAFRGAQVGNMHAFERDFAVPRVIRLEQNYRSFGTILDAANALIAHNAQRLGKNLWTAAGRGEPIRVVELNSDIDEANWLAGEVQGLAARGVNRSDIAVLYRSNAQSRVIEHAFFSAGLPYRVYGGLRFFERLEIKHALAYLRLIANPNDDGAFLRVVNFPARGIGARSLEQLQEQAAGAMSLHQAVPRLGGKGGLALGNFVALVERLRVELTRRRLPELVALTLEQSGLVAHYESERDGADRVENLRELVNAAESYLRENEAGDLAAFLAHASLEAGDHQAGDGHDAVQLMTVHAAKGLEFSVVFVTGLEEGLFPHEQSSMVERALEEERRLMYVAITRARRQLYLSLAQTRMLHGATRYNLPSRFLTEIPAPLIDWKKRSGRPQFGAPSVRHQPAPFERPAVPIAAAPSGWRIGQNVAHPKFGAGVIIGADGSGAQARVQINFRGAGVKWLALQYARLTPA